MVQLALLYHMRPRQDVLTSPQLQMQAGCAISYLRNIWLVPLHSNLRKLTSLSDCRQVPAYELGCLGDDEAPASDRRV